MGIRRWIVSAAALLAACATIAAPAETSRQAAHPPAGAVVSAQPTAAAPTSGEVLRTTLQTIAILVAVTVFLTREGLEARRRRTSRLRKVAAIKTVLARACELNHWTIKSLKRQFASISSDYDGVPVSEFSVSFGRDGRAVLVHNQDGEITGSSPLLEAELGDFKAALMDVAELDPDLLPLLDDAITGLEELNHVRSSLIDFLLNKNDPYYKFFPSFLEYACEQVQDTFTIIDTFYFACTGKNLTQHRVR